jgi:hypothetical protein
MKFLCLAYGSEAGWNTLSRQEQLDALAQDEVLRRQGNFMSAVKVDVTTVTNWDQKLVATNQSFASPRLPLAGFSILEAKDIDEAIQLVSNTPCARASGAIEIRPFLELTS